MLKLESGFSKRLQTSISFRSEVGSTEVRERTPPWSYGRVFTSLHTAVAGLLDEMRKTTMKFIVVFLIPNKKLRDFPMRSLAIRCCFANLL